MAAIGNTKTIMIPTTVDDDIADHGDEPHAECHQGLNHLSTQQHDGAEQSDADRKRDRSPRLGSKAGEANHDDGRKARNQDGRHDAHS